MTQKKRVKIFLDVLMSALLLFLMAYQVTENRYHEWIGTVMLILFCLHNGLNRRWYKAVAKGRYNGTRIYRTALNILLVVSILLTGYSGIVMSRDVFAFLPLKGQIALARKIHLSGSYWSFVLMGLHIGVHWTMVTTRLFKERISAGDDGARTKNAEMLLLWILRAVAFAAAVYGAYLTGKNRIFDNMFLRTAFAVFDYESSAVRIVLNNLLMLTPWIWAGHYGGRFLISMQGKKIKRAVFQILSILIVLSFTVVGIPQQETDAWENFSENTDGGQQSDVDIAENMVENVSDSVENIPEKGQAIKAGSDFVFIQGGTFQMGSPESENWRSGDEALHTVTIDDFYMSKYEVSQELYEQVMQNNPSTFSGADLPVENVSWREAIAFCNALSQKEGLVPVYEITEAGVSWNTGADGYRIPTEAEWEYACRAGTVTPFNTETSISAEEANYYGHYPYDIEQNYFDQNNLTTKPGEYRQTTVSTDSFEPNAWGLYNMHGNVSEWVWDYYGAYDDAEAVNPTGPESGTLKVYRGGGWNDFAKNMRSAYRATMEENKGSFNIGIRLVRNAYSGEERFVGAAGNQDGEVQDRDGNVLIAYFSWGGNTRGIAQEIQNQTGADIFEITLTEPYSDDYNTVLDQSQYDQSIQARPELLSHVDNMEEYDIVLLGYPNWWASIPMPIASFLEEYDFSQKTIIPFCSHGGGRFGQSLTAIAKLAPDAAMGDALSVHYSGGSTLESDIAGWLEKNGVKRE